MLTSPGVDAIVHIANDVSLSDDPNKVITPTVNAIKGMLELANKEPSIKRFVLTSSSIASIPAPIPEEEFTIDANSWNLDVIDKSWNPPSGTAAPFDVYAASKVLGEQALWEGTKNSNIHFVSNAVLPFFTIGSVIHDKLHGSTNTWLRSLYDNDAEATEIIKSLGPSYYVNVEDIARLHVGATIFEDVKNQRLFGFAGKFDFNTLLDALHKVDPARPLPAKIELNRVNRSTVDNKSALDILKRFGQDDWVSFEKSVRDNVA
jgi:nucleoside-diphosphate-sugar epimerase